LPPIAQANHFVLFAGVKSEYSQKRYLDETKRLLDVLEMRLSETPYLAGDKYTIADICSIGWVHTGSLFLGIDLSERPALKRWCDTILARPAVQKGLKTPPHKFTEEQMAAKMKDLRELMNAR
jgi:glutathione S-transferase